MSFLHRSMALLFLIAGMLPSFSYAQQRSCGTTELHQQNLQNPDYARSFRAKLDVVRKMTNSGDRVLCSNPVQVPVAVHFQGINNPDASCLIALAQNQIAILNADFQGSNTDISNWINDDSPLFPGIGYSETCMEFCLANQNHPTGFGLNNGDLAVTVNAFTGSNNSNWDGYLNIFVRNIGGLGFSPLGGDGDGDGVTVDVEAFGSGSGCTGVVPDPPYDLGRTLTHEVGHYLLLGHIWGGGCGSDDGIADTPDQASSNFGCPSSSASSCGSLDLHMNYMDYTNDACMYMFSEDQGTTMENYLSSSLGIITSNAANVCGSGAAPTCTDGIQNGQETGIDCGGPDCPPCPPMYCTSRGNNTSDEWIESVAIGSFSNVSGDNGGYADFTNMTIDLEQGISTAFTLTPGWSGTIYNEYFRIWVDMNQDGDFEDAGEMIYDQGSANQNSTQTGNITVPNSSTLGMTRMRVSMKYNNSPNPCETFTYGEVEDYSVNIILPLGPPNNFCSGAIPIFGGNFPGTLINATTIGNPFTCMGLGLSGPTVWYTFTSSGNETFEFDVCGAPIDTRMHLYSGNCLSLTCVAANDDFCGDDARIQFTAPISAAPIDYYLLISGANNASSTFVLNVSSAPLAVDLLSFSGKAETAGNVLTWITANEVDLDYFSVERSNDLNIWSSIEEVAPKGSAESSSTYTYVDEDPERISYYRLVSKDFDGSQATSDVIQIERNSQDIIRKLFPNPANEFININISTPKNVDGNYIIRDISGREIYAQSVQLKRGEQLLQIDVQQWTAGVYFIQWELDGIVSNDRFVVQ